MKTFSSCLVLMFCLATVALRATDGSTVGTPANSLPSAAPDAASRIRPSTSAVPASPAMVAEAAPQTALSGSDNSSGAVRPDEYWIWLALAGVLAISLVAMGFTWHASVRSRVPAQPSAPGESPAVLASNLLPVISQAIKESLMQELAAQRRELLSSQQSAAAELAGLARRLEAVQTPMLERLVAPRPAMQPASQPGREIPVNLSCGCGQKYSVEVPSAAVRMPFPVRCPVCGQDGTLQANQAIAQSLPGDGRQAQSFDGAPSPISAPATPAARPVAAVQRTLATEPALPQVGHSKITPIPVANESAPDANGEGSPDAGLVARLVAEGQALADSGELEKSLKCLETALALQPDRAGTLVKLGGVLDKLDRADEALQYYDRAIALDETLTIAYLNKGGLFNRLARYDEALRCYEQALHKQKKSTA